MEIYDSGKTELFSGYYSFCVPILGILILLCLSLTRIAQDPKLSFQELKEDLNQFQMELEERFAYLKANNADYKTAIQAIREKGKNGMSVEEFGLELSKIIGLFKDCHAFVGGFEYPAGYLPFFIESINNRYIAVRRDRSGFIDNLFPFIRKIDGRAIDDWLSLISDYVAKGSPQIIKYRSLHFLQSIQFAHFITGEKPGQEITVELETKNGKDRKSITLEVSNQKPEISSWPDSQSHLMEGNIGYLRLKTMTQSAFEEIAHWMPRFRDTAGLIIDVRDNNGGTRNVLRELFPYFMKNTDKPRVANAAKYKIYKDTGPGYLDSRYMFPQNWKGWSPAERGAVNEFMQSFRPEWNLPEKEFSEWHFWVLSKRSKPDAYYYSKPVVFLMNQKCFSAADIVLSSVKGFGNITLVGYPSGGGSGAARASKLKNSNLSLRLSSMASFQSSGRLFDGTGVYPDIFIEPEPEYFLEGGPDNILKKALEIITGHSHLP